MKLLKRKVSIQYLITLISWYWNTMEETRELSIEKELFDLEEISTIVKYNIESNIGIK